MAPVVPKTKLGSQGLVVSAQGLGCMSMSGSGFFGPPKPEPDMIKLIREAIVSGVTFLDTSDFYGANANEILIGKALKDGYREKAQIGTKFGYRLIDGKTEVCGDPAYVRSACEASLKRLDIDCIDLYYAHRIDTRIPIEIMGGGRRRLRCRERDFVDVVGDIVGFMVVWIDFVLPHAFNLRILTLHDFYRLNCKFRYCYLCIKKLRGAFTCK